MTISTGDRLPEATLIRMGEGGPETVSLGSLTDGRKVVIFAVPGAFTKTCSMAHMPSFIRTKEKFDEKGVEVMCVAVNDPFVMKAWGEATGADKAGIAMLSDATSAFTGAMGMAFDAPTAGLLARSRRYALYAEDGVVQVLHEEESPGACDVSGGEAMLEAI